jgi:hypothetical protein
VQKIGDVGQGMQDAMTAMDPVAAIGRIVSDQPSMRKLAQTHPQVADAVNTILQVAGNHAAGSSAAVPSAARWRDAWNEGSEAADNAIQDANQGFSVKGSTLADIDAAIQAHKDSLQQLIQKRQYAADRAKEASQRMYDQWVAAGKPGSGPQGKRNVQVQMLPPGATK